MKKKTLLFGESYPLKDCPAEVLEMLDDAATRVGDNIQIFVPIRDDVQMLGYRGKAKQELKKLLRKHGADIFVISPAMARKLRLPKVNK
jgi:hypothetical protein